MLKGKFDNLKNLSKTVPGESNGFAANPDRVAVPIAGPGGKIAVFEASRPGRIPDGVQPVLINGATVLDFGFDPFDNTSKFALFFTFWNTLTSHIPITVIITRTSAYNNFKCQNPWIVLFLCISVKN